MSTTMPKAGEVSRKWYIIDAEGKPLGRVAAKAAKAQAAKEAAEKAKAAKAAKAAEAAQKKED